MPRALDMDMLVLQFLAIILLDEMENKTATGV
jgi:hypothetical protein